MYQYHGSVAAVVAYVEAVWSEVAMLYANEGISLLISSIKVWDVQDPYEVGNGGTPLASFREGVKGWYPGNLAHLMGYGGGGGNA